MSITFLKCPFDEKAAAAASSHTSSVIPWPAAPSKALSATKLTCNSVLLKILSDRISTLGLILCTRLLILPPKTMLQFQWSHAKIKPQSKILARSIFPQPLSKYYSLLLSSMHRISDAKQLPFKCNKHLDTVQQEQFKLQRGLNCWK